MVALDLFDPMGIPPPASERDADQSADAGRGRLGRGAVVEVAPEAPLTLTHAWRLPPLAPGQLLVRIAKGLPGLGGYELKDDWTALVTVPDFPRQLEFTATGGLLSLNGERKLALKSRGVSHIRYTVARIPLEQINHLASMTRGRFESPVWRSSAFDEQNIAQIRSRVVPTGKVNDWQSVWSTFDFREFLAAADPSCPDAAHGMFFIKAEAVKPRLKPKAGNRMTNGKNVEGDDAQEAATEEQEPQAGGNGHDDRNPDWSLVTVSRRPLPAFKGGDEERTDMGDTSGQGPSRFVLVTDLGLLVKENADKSRDIFVQSMQGRGPAAGVALSVVAKNGESVQTAVTDADGHARLEAADSFTGDRKPVVLVARLGNDASFLPLGRQERKLDFSRFATGGLESGGPDTLDGFVFTERGVYRPGDTVHAGMVVRLRSGGMPPEGLPVTAVVANSASREVFRQTLMLPADGMVEFSGALKAADPTGIYSLQVMLFPDRADRVVMGGTRFRVEDFEPDTMKLKVDLPGVPERGWSVEPKVAAVLEFLDAGGQSMARCFFTVVGKGNADRSLEQNAELEMKPSREEWESGQDLVLSLRAPFTGAGLLTIEREKVWTWKWFQSADKESVQTIRVPEGIEGSAYVQAAFVRAADSPEVFMSPLSYAVQHVRVNYGRRLMPLTLEVPERIRPGETLRATLRSPSPSRAVIYMVDEGIHRITDYQLPQPRDFFLQTRGLEVGTSQILDLLMPEYTILGRSRAFGGDGDGGLMLNLNPFQRKREAPVVFWSGLVSTGPDGVTVEYPVPDSFSGQLTVMAVAAGPSGYSSAQNKTVVRGPFVLTPNAPRFAAPDDTFTVSLAVANNVENAGPEAAKVTARLTASGNIKVIQSPEPVEIAPGREETVRFEIAVQEPLGNATLTFSAESAGVSASSRTVTLSVRPATPRMTTVQSGYYRQPDHEVKPRRDLYPEFADREISSSALPLNLARGLAAWLREFPHGCTEQTVSRAMPRLLLSSEASFGFDRTAAVADLDKVFALLRGRQAPNGGFGTWDNKVAGQGIDFLSVYVTDFLISAKEAGFAVPDDLLKPALKNLREMAVLTPNSTVAATAQARAIYLLTRSGEVTTNYLLNLRDTLEKSGEWRRGPAALWIACTHAQLHQDQEAGKIIEQWRKPRKRPVDVWQFWQEQPLALEALDIALLSRHFPDVAGSLKYDDLQPMLQGLEKAEYNTYSAACCVQALKAWSDLQKESGVQTSLTELTAGAAPRLLTVPGSGLLTAGFSSGAVALRFGLIRPEGAPDLGAFYQVVESGFDRSPPDKELREDRNVIHFDLDNRDRQVFSYRIRPVCAGTVVMPPVFVNSLYRPAVQGRDKAGKITAVPR